MEVSRGIMACAPIYLVSEFSILTDSETAKVSRRRFITAGYLDLAAKAYLGQLGFCIVFRQ